MEVIEPDKPVSEDKKEEKKPDKWIISFEVLKKEHGFDVALTEGCMIPPNDILIMGMFEKAKNQALAFYFNAVMKKEMSKPKIIVSSGNPLGDSLKKKFNKILH